MRRRRAASRPCSTARGDGRQPRPSAAPLAATFLPVRGHPGRGEAGRRGRRRVATEATRRSGSTGGDGTNASPETDRPSDRARGTSEGRQPAGRALDEPTDERNARLPPAADQSSWSIAVHRRRRRNTSARDHVRPAQHRERQPRLVAERDRKLIRRGFTPAATTVATISRRSGLRRERVVEKVEEYGPASLRTDGGNTPPGRSGVRGRRGTSSRRSARPAARAWCTRKQHRELGRRHPAAGGRGAPGAPSRSAPGRPSGVFPPVISGTGRDRRRYDRGGPDRGPHNNWQVMKVPPSC